MGSTSSQRRGKTEIAETATAREGGMAGGGETGEGGGEGGGEEEEEGGEPRG